MSMRKKGVQVEKEREGKAIRSGRLEKEMKRELKAILDMGVVDFFFLEKRRERKALGGRERARAHAHAHEHHRSTPAVVTKWTCPMSASSRREWLSI